MSIDLEKALGAELAPTSGSWSRDDVILYHLGIGAGVGKATDPKELEYAYERNLKVLPSFGVVPVFDAVMQMNSVPGIDINFGMVLHGEQELEIHRTLPPEAEVDNTGRISKIYDKGKAALIVIEAVTTEKGGDKLCTNRFSVFARGEGGFGGESGPQPRIAIRILWLTPRQRLIKRSSTDCRATKIRFMRIRASPRRADLMFRSFTGFARSAWSVRRSSTRHSMVTFPA